jgi:hypothetical protein
MSSVLQELAGNAQEDIKTMKLYSHFERVDMELAAAGMPLALALPSRR